MIFYEIVFANRGRFITKDKPSFGTSPTTCEVAADLTPTSSVTAAVLAISKGQVQKLHVNPSHVAFVLEYEVDD